ncbi:MAG: carboxypeptidase regulatory-like domain-containing protein [Bryobacterales bacterium]|nr:carboxypeptidase regulatory-like domain-containing protein [Bryobacterales bacterium]
MKTLLVFAFLSIAAFAQVETTTSITGAVADPQGAVFAGASVKLTNQNTGALRETRTSAEGVYSFQSLPAGRYTLVVSAPGFKTTAITDRVVETAQPAHIDIRLELGATSEQVTVSAAGAELVNTASAEVTGSVTPELVQNIPLGRGNVFDLLQLTPGVVPQNAGQNLSFAGRSLNFVDAGNTFQSSGAFIAGNRDSASNISIDGSNIQIPVYGQATQLQSRASVNEVRVEAASMSAEFGNGVAAVNFITKSGSNAYHGELFEYFRNNHLDANSYLNNEANRRLQPYTQNQFGGAIGGPVIRNKLLFFGNYEGFRVVQREQQFAVVPDENLRRGDFSQYKPPGPGGTFLPTPVIYNPYDADPATGLRRPFPGNRIPAGQTSACAPRQACIDPVTQAYLDKFVLSPNTVVNGVDQYTNAVRTTMTQNQVTGRADWLRGANSTIFARFTYNKQDTLQGGLQPLQGTGNNSASTNAVLHWTQVLGPSKVNDLGLSYTRPNWQYTRPLDLPDSAAAIGLPNTSGYTGGVQWSVAGFNLGAGTNYIFNAYSNNVQLKDDFSWVRGRHNLKFGVDAVNKRFIYYNPSGDKGQFSFSKLFTQACPPGNTRCDQARAAAGAPVGGNEFADYLLGAYSSTLLIIRQIPYVGHQQYLGFYAQDSWRVTNKLTLNYGLRYEYWSPWAVPRNATLSFNYQTGQPAFALQNPNDFLDPGKCFGACAPLTPGVPREAYAIGTKNFAPRLGVTYALTPSTVVRAGGGIYYDGNINMNQFNDIQSGAAPFSLRYEVVNDTSRPLPARLVSNEYPAGLLGVPPQPNANPPASFRFAQPYYPIPAVYQWSFSVQRRLGQSWVGEADYVGSHTIHQFQFIDQNAADLPQGAIANVPLQQRRPYPQWGVLGTWAPLGWARYEAGTASIKNNQWHGLTLQGNFSWAKNIATSNINNSDHGNINYRYPYIWAGPSNITPKFWFITALNYQTPKIAVGKALGYAVNDWVLSGAFTAATGSPQFPVTQDLSGTGYSGASSTFLPNRICDANQGADIRTRLRWFNTGCFTDPAFGTWGNAAFGVITDPGINNWNIATAKRFRMPYSESHAVEFRGDFLNAFNHTQFLASDKNLRSVTYGRINAVRPPRQIQFALRYIF